LKSEGNEAVAALEVITRSDPLLQSLDHLTFRSVSRDDATPRSRSGWRLPKRGAVASLRDTGLEDPAHLRIRERKATGRFRATTLRRHVSIWIEEQADWVRPQIVRNTGKAW